MPIPLTGPFAANPHADAIKSPLPDPSGNDTGPKSGDDSFHNIFASPPAENDAKDKNSVQTAARSADKEDTEGPGGPDHADDREDGQDFKTADTEDVDGDQPLLTMTDDKSGPHLNGSGDKTSTVQGPPEQIDKHELAGGENTSAGLAPEFAQAHVKETGQSPESVSVAGNLPENTYLWTPAVQGRISDGNDVQAQTQRSDLSGLVDDGGAKLPNAVDSASVPKPQSPEGADQGQFQTSPPVAGSDRLPPSLAKVSVMAAQAKDQLETKAKTVKDSQEQTFADPTRQVSDRYSASVTEPSRAASASQVNMAITSPPALAGLAPFAGKTLEVDRHIPTTDTGVIYDTRTFSDLGSIAKSAADPVFQSQIPRHLALQVAGAVHRAGADQPVSLLLNPAELGRVKISMTTTDAGVSVTVVADRPETLDLMRRHIDVLAQEFRDIGYGSSQFSFGQSASEHRGETQHGGQGQALSVDPATDGITPLTAPSITVDRVDIRL